MLLVALFELWVVELSDEDERCEEFGENVWWGLLHLALGRVGFSCV